MAHVIIIVQPLNICKDWGISDILNYLIQVEAICETKHQPKEPQSREQVDIVILVIIGKDLVFDSNVQVVIGRDSLCIDLKEVLFEIHPQIW